MGRRIFTVTLAFLFLCAAAPGCGPGSDNDGVDAGPPELPDADGDGIADVHEGRPTGDDTDGDGIPDYLDEDSDGDGIPDYREAGDDHTGTPPIDSDGDGIPNFRDEDSDDNGRPDGVDGVEDLDGDGTGNFADLDDDGDGINDSIEIGDNPEAPLDSDSDGLPDFQDVDSDNDTIGDRWEGMGDFDEDDLPAYIDLESDGDCIPDMLEAGDTDLATPPVDTDGDGQYDFLDLDSDNDGLLDSLEDVNCNGIADPGESSRIDDDTDNDGVSDLIENAAGTDPTDPGDNPQNNGDFVFIVPYEQPPMPDEDTLDFSTNIVQADVVFGMDGTGSMGQEIGQLKTGVTNLINTIRTNIPNTGFGVVEYRDFPTSPYGGTGDRPFGLRHRVMTTDTGAGLTSIQNQVNGYIASGGADGPESGWEMLFQTATGAGVNAGGANIPAFDPATAPPNPPPAGEEIGDGGGVGFRIGSLPIVVWITDACSHNSDGGYNYSFGGVATMTSAVDALNAIMARTIAVVSDPQTGGCNAGDARTHGLYAVNQTNAIVPPEAWGPAGTRPAGCAVGQCCTGLNGAGEAASGGQCPLLFRVDGNTGAGLSDAVATAIQVLTLYGEFDISGEPVDDPSDAVDALASFVNRIEATAVAGAPCENGIPVTDVNTDGINETFPDVNPGITVCFDVVPKMNTTVPALETPQMFEADIIVWGDWVTELDRRTIYFLVPPVIEDIPIG